MAFFHRRAAARPSRRNRVVSSWPQRRIVGEALERRTLLAANLSFAIPGPNGDQALAVRTDAAGNVYELATDAVYKFSPAGAQIWAATYTALSQLDQKEGLAVDNSGDVYITGNFYSDTAVFGSTTLTEVGIPDAYLAKLDSNGNFVWAESLGASTSSTNGYSVATDSLGDVYLTGDYSNTLTIGAGSQAKTLPSQGFTDILVAKFDSNGSLLWANGYDNTSFDHGYGIAVDAQGNAYVTGLFAGTLDFNPASPGRNTLTTFFSTDFILKLDTDGRFVWVKQIQANTSVGDGRAEGDAIAVDAAGNVYNTGIFGGPVDLNPNGGDLNTTADFVFPDAFVVKLNSSGGFAWAADLHNASTGGVIGGLQPRDIAVDAAGNVYTTGNFQGVANFDPTGQDLVTAQGGTDVYVSQLTNQGNLGWVATAGAAKVSTSGYGVAVSSAPGGAYVYATGIFSGTVNFNSGVGGADNVTANGVWDGFLWGLTTLPTRIAGIAWNDENSDGIRQSSEPGVPGVGVLLFVGPPGSGTQVASTVTDTLGLYSFNGVAVGKNYYVQVVTPPADSFSPEDAGTDPTIASNVSTAAGISNAVSVASGQTAIVNAGLENATVPPGVNLAFGVATDEGLEITEGSSILADAAGNIYVGGNFQGTSTFGSGSASVTLSTTSRANDFLAKYSSSGALLWVQQVVSDDAQDDAKIGFDPSGNIYMAGVLNGDASIGTVSLPASGTTPFLAKFDSNGNVLWATTVLTNAVDLRIGLAVDPNGNAYVVGGFSQSATVDTAPATTLTSAGGNDVFVVKYTPSGAAQWAESFGGNADDAADSAAVDPSGNLVITGSYGENLPRGASIQFGGTTLSNNGGSLNDFVVKLNAADGSVAWADALTGGATGAIGPAEGYHAMSRIAVDSQGNVYTTGTFGVTAQLDPTGGTDALTASGTFISKLDTNGKFVWGKSFVIGPNGYDVQGLGIAVDSVGDVFTTGTFARTINFNPNGTPAENFTSISSPPGFGYDIFLSELTTDGNFVGAQQFGGTSDEDYGTAVSVDAKGNVYATGVSGGPATFGTITVGGKNEQDIFVVRLANPSSSLVNKAPSFTINGPLQSLGLNPPPQVVPGFASNIVPGPRAETNELINFIVTNDNPSLFTVQPSIDSNGTLTYTAAPNAGGTANVIVVLHNNGGTANSGSDTSAPQTFPITIDVNHAPTFTAGPNQAVNENSAAHTVLAWATNLSAGPPDEAGQALNFVVTTDNSSLFAAPPIIDVATGNLIYTLARNVYGKANVTVELHDNGGTANGGEDTSPPQTFSISVNFVNQPPSFVAGPNQSTNENSGPQKASSWATNISAGPPSESSEKLKFLVSTDNDALFSSLPTIDPTTGALTYTPAFDANGVANVTVQLQDDGGTANGGTDTSPPQSFTITVNYVNQAPFFTAGPNVNALENSGPQTVAAWATGIDPGAPNEAGQTLTFTVTNDNSSLFSVQPKIDPITGNLSFTPAVNTYGVANVSVRLHDDGGTANGGTDVSAVETFTITVAFVNQAPTFTAGANQAVNENAGTQTVLGWATSISPGPSSEALEQLNFIVTTDDSALFPVPPSIDPVTGDLTYTAAPGYSGLAHVTVALHDNGGTANGGLDTSAPQTFTITINFINQEPSFTAGPDQIVHETPGPQTVPGWAASINPGSPDETKQKLDFQITTDNNGLFSSPPAIDPATGALTYTPAAYATGVAHMTIRLHDDGGTANGGVDTSPPQTFTISVTPSNQAPVFSPGSDVVLKGSFGAVTVPAWATNIGAGPPDETGQALNFIVTTDNSAMFAVVPALDPVSGDLTFTPQPGMTGQAHVTVELHDNGGTVNGGVDTSAPLTFRIAVTFVNQSPTFTAGPAPTVNENGGPQMIPGWATNIVAGPPDEAYQSDQFIINTDNNALFAVLPAIDPATGNLTYTPAHNANGVAQVSVQLHDNGGTANGGQDTSVAQTFAVTVNPVNQPPYFTAGPSLIVKENSGSQTYPGWATAVSAGAENESSQKLNFLVSTDNSALFAAGPAIDPTTGNLTFTPAPGASGVAHVAVQIHDNGGTANGGQDTSPTQTFTITETFVNQPPTFTAGPNQSVAENAGPQTVAGWATNITAGPPSQAAEALNFIVTTDNPSLFSSLPQIDPATGNLTYTPAPNTSGLAHVAVELHNSGGIANGGQDTSLASAFTIAVNFLNEAPSFVLAGDPPAVNENSGAQTVLSFASHISASGSYPTVADELSQTVHFNVIDDTNPALFAVPPAIDSRGTLTYVLNPQVDGTAQITVDLQDNGGTANGGADTSPTQTFNIVANFVNQAPSITHLGPNQVATEDSAPATVTGFAAATAGAGPTEVGQHVSYIVTASNPGLFAANGQPAIDPSGTLTFTPGLHAYGTTTVTVAAKDDGGTANGGIDTSLSSTFRVEIDRVNHAPTVAQPIAAVNVNENAADYKLTSLANVFDDVDFDQGLGDPMTLSLGSNSNSALVTASLLGS
ncbi:MAG TPA: SBBP repeat-containing protein, partial [Pirellulales bacterium]|nr:SBBP repeat-containing protein [Pirellulales bacterium]